MGLWWVNFLAGCVCSALAVNFFAQAYGLRLGGRPLDTSTLPIVDPSQIGGGGIRSE